jgi:hypothetical protein
MMAVWLSVESSAFEHPNGMSARATSMSRYGLKEDVMAESTDSHQVPLR